MFDQILKMFPDLKDSSINLTAQDGSKFSVKSTGGKPAKQEANAVPPVPQPRPEGLVPQMNQQQNVVPPMQQQNMIPPPPKTEAVPEFGWYDNLKEKIFDPALPQRAAEVIPKVTDLVDGVASLPLFGAAVGPVTSKPTSGHAARNWEKRYGTTHNIDGTVKGGDTVTKGNVVDKNALPEGNVTSMPTSGHAKSQWIKKHGETHNLDGSPKEVVSDNVVTKGKTGNAGGFVYKNEGGTWYSYGKDGVTKVGTVTDKELIATLNSDKTIAKTQKFKGVTYMPDGKGGWATQMPDGKPGETVNDANILATLSPKSGDAGNVVDLSDKQPLLDKIPPEEQQTAMNWVSDTFGFNGQDVARFLLYWAGGLATGGSRDGSSNWAARQVLKESTSRAAGVEKGKQSFQAFALKNGNRYKPEDLAEAQKLAASGKLTEAYSFLGGKPKIATAEEITTSNEKIATSESKLKTTLATDFRTINGGTRGSDGKWYDNPLQIKNGQLKGEKIGAGETVSQYVQFIQRKAQGNGSVALWNKDIHSSIYATALRSARNDPNFNGDITSYLEAEFSKNAQALGVEAGDKHSNFGGLNTEQQTYIISQADQAAKNFGTVGVGENKRTATSDHVLSAINKQWTNLGEQRANFGEKGYYAFAETLLNQSREKIVEFDRWVKGQPKGTTITMAEVTAFFNQK